MGCARMMQPPCPIRPAKRHQNVRSDWRKATISVCGVVAIFRPNLEGVLMGEIAIEEEWQTFREAVLNWPEVEDGRMMSSPAVTRGGKVFAFQAGLGSCPGLGLRIGSAAKPGDIGSEEWEKTEP